MVVVSVNVTQIVPVEFNPNSVVALSLERKGMTSHGFLNLSRKLLERLPNTVYMLLDRTAK